MSAAKELSEAVEFVCALVGAIAESAEDGKISIGDAAHLVPLLYKLPSALDGLSDVVFSDLSESELAAVAAKVKGALDLKDDKVEAIIEDVIDITLELYALVQKLRA